MEGIEVSSCIVEGRKDEHRINSTGYAQVLVEVNLWDAMTRDHEFALW